ncbi:pimeloyl-ACP methyl ester carboxylesterase [Ancylobacter aquaticus]|uniref:Pimeloyl-ACP methyl ester carboxylesterase n=2 Tax=Ancylobacter aquaticus TaxID=100 RepID=A0A4R1I6Y0_ANCAQ|nr:pimeloyl-ACP methyl ester carboxylesterase [Ancylobacter aquaticus]
MRKKGFEPIVFDDPFVKFGKNYGTVPSLIDFVKEALLPHKSRETVVFGNSMGGYIALALASDPEFNIKQAIVSGCPGAGENVTLGLGVSRILSLDYAHKISRELFHDPSRLDTAMIESTFREIANRQCFMMGLSILRSLQKIDVRDFIDSVAVDTHLIWGAHDRVTPIDPWRDMAAANPALHLHSIADAGHCPMIETPDAFNAVLERVLYKERAAPSPMAASEARPAP